MRLDNKNVILTGAASGIGRALLDQFSGFSVRVMTADCDAAGLGEARAEGRAQIFPHPCDLCLPGAVDGLFEHALQAMGGVDLFIANAGFAYYEKLEQPDWQHIQRIFEVNVFSPIYALQKMRALNPNQSFKVVVTASAMSHLGVPGYALYSATKASLHRFAETYRFELEDPRSLALVYPIATRTAFFGSSPRAWPSQSAEQVARAMIRGIQRDQLEIYPSAVFRLFMYLPFLHRLEQTIEARRLRKWLENGL